MHKLFLSIIFFLMVLFSFNSISAEESAMIMSIGGDVMKPGQWSAEQLRVKFADQIKEIKFIDQSWQKKTATGIPLYSVIKAAEPMIEKETKWTKRDRADSKLHAHMTFFVILEARDTFRAFFSLAELMPELGSTEVYLVWDIEGEPLSGKEVPFRLATVNAKMPDRQIYAISSITVVNGDKLANQLKAE